MCSTVFVFEENIHHLSQVVRCQQSMSMKASINFSPLFLVQRHFQILDIFLHFYLSSNNVIRKSNKECTDSLVVALMDNWMKWCAVKVCVELEKPDFYLHKSEKYHIKLQNICQFKCIATSYRTEGKVNSLSKPYHFFIFSWDSLSHIQSKGSLDRVIILWHTDLANLYWL